MRFEVIYNSKVKLLNVIVKDEDNDIVRAYEFNNVNVDSIADYLEQIIDNLL